MSAQATLSLGNASREIDKTGNVYTLPITTDIDGYSTLKILLFGGGEDFLAQTTTELTPTETGTLLKFRTPQHIAPVDLTVQVNYQGQTAKKTYRLTSSEYGIDASGNGELQVCRGQWILEGTLLGNITRIATVCGRSLGRWPESEKHYRDFVIRKATALPGAGDLLEMLDYVRVYFGFVSPNVNSNVISFIDLTRSK